MVSRRLGLLIIGIAAAVGLTVTAGWSAQPAVNAQADAATVTLTATLEVTDGAVLRDTHYVWAGPESDPMLRVTGALSAALENLTFEVAEGHHATAAVELAGGAAGGPLGNTLTNLRVGSIGEPARMDYGLQWVGITNGDSNVVTDVVVYNVGKAGVAVANPQATGNTIRGLFVFHSPIGLQSAAGGTITCDTCGFIGSTDVDVALDNGAGLVLTGVYSEGARSFARIVAGPGGGGLSVTGGYWQHGPAAAGATFTGQNMCCARSWLRLTDFMVTPLPGGPHGTVTGVPADKLFLTNVAGVAT